MVSLHLKIKPYARAQLEQNTPRVNPNQTSTQEPWAKVWCLQNQGLLNIKLTKKQNCEVKSNSMTNRKFSLYLFCFYKILTNTLCFLTEMCVNFEDFSFKSAISKFLLLVWIFFLILFLSAVESEAFAYVCIFIGAKLMLGSNPTSFEINWNFSLD